MKSTVVDESLSSFKPMYCSREYQASTRLSQQYEKSTSNIYMIFHVDNKVYIKGRKIYTEIQLDPTNSQNDKINIQSTII